jgi:hypothetical protein
MSILTSQTLARENREFYRTGGRSEENRGFGFRPAFMDSETGIVYASRFRDGSDAPFHLIDGLPDAVVLRRHASGGVAAVKCSVVSGFVRNGEFYRREEAAYLAASEDPSAIESTGCQAQTRVDANSH